MWTRTNRNMVNHRAFGARSAGPRTRISTFFIETSKISWAFRVNNTFRSTVWCNSLVTSSTWTAWRTAYISAFRIRSTRGGYTWIDILRYDRICWRSCKEKVSCSRANTYTEALIRQKNMLTRNRLTSCEWIARISVTTVTDWTVVYNATLCI